MNQELRASVRSVARSPRHLVLIAGCLALSLGANTAMFAVVDALFLRPPPLIRDPVHLVRVYFDRRVPNIGSLVTDLASFPAFTALRGDTSTFEQLAAYYPTIVSEGEGPSAERLRVNLVTSNFFQMVGARAAIG